MSTNIPVCIGRRSVSSQGDKIHVHAVTIVTTRNNNTPINSTRVDTSIAACVPCVIDQSSINMVNNMPQAVSMCARNFDIYDAFSDKFSAKPITNEGSKIVSCGETVNIETKMGMDKNGGATKGSIKVKKKCVGIKTTGKNSATVRKDCAAKNTLEDKKVNVLQMSNKLKKNKVKPVSNLISITLDENKNEQSEKNCEKKDVSAVQGKTTKQKNKATMKKVQSNKNKVNSTQTILMSQENENASVHKQNVNNEIVMEPESDLTTAVTQEKTDCDNSMSSKNVNRKSKRKRSHSSYSVMSGSDFSNSCSYSSYSGYERSRSRDRYRHERSYSRGSYKCERSYSRDSRERSYSRGHYRHERSYSRDRYKYRRSCSRDRYSDKRYTSDRRSSLDNLSYSDSISSCNSLSSYSYSDHERSQNTYSYLDDIDRYASEQLEYTKYTSNYRYYPPYSYMYSQHSDDRYSPYSDRMYSPYSGRRSKYSKYSHSRSPSKIRSRDCSYSGSSVSEYCSSCDTSRSCSPRSHSRRNRSHSGTRRKFRSSRSRSYSTHSHYRKKSRSSRSRSRCSRSHSRTKRMFRSSRSLSHPRTERSRSPRSHSCGPRSESRGRRQFRSSRSLCRGSRSHSRAKRSHSRGSSCQSRTKRKFRSSRSLSRGSRSHSRTKRYRTRRSRSYSICSRTRRNSRSSSLTRKIPEKDISSTCSLEKITVSIISKDKAGQNLKRNFEKSSKGSLPVKSKVGSLQNTVNILSEKKTTHSEAVDRNSACNSSNPPKNIKSKGEQETSKYKSNKSKKEKTVSDSSDESSESEIVTCKKKEQTFCTSRMIEKEQTSCTKVKMESGNKCDVKTDLDKNKADSDKNKTEAGQNFKENSIANSVFQSEKNHGSMDGKDRTGTENGAKDSNTGQQKQGKVKINLTNRLPKIRNMTNKNLKGRKIKQTKKTKYTADQMKLLMEIGQYLRNIWKELLANIKIGVSANSTNT